MHVSDFVKLSGGKVLHEEASDEGALSHTATLGDGSILTYQTLHDSLENLILPPEHRMHQCAAGVAMLAEKMLLRGEICDAESLQPNYLRLSQAERERLEKGEHN